MFAYCGNNPIKNQDPSGEFFIDWDLLPNQQAGEELGRLIISFADRYQEVEEEKKTASSMTFEPNPKGGGKLKNAYIVDDLGSIASYSAYLVHESEYSESFHGSHQSVFVEWVVHEMACYVPGFDFNQAKDVDFGYTIFDDSHGVFSFLLRGVYAALYPEQYQKDFFAYLDQIGGK